MRILFLGLNYRPEEIGIAVYSAGLCEALAARGHSVAVVTAKPYYPGWKVRPGYGGGWRTSREANVTVIRSPIYVPAQPTGARRILHHLSFALTALIPVLWQAWRFRPDLVVTTAPSLVAAPVALAAARLARVPAWLHVQDFEVEAAFAMGLLNPRSRLARIARKVEHGLVRRFDQVSSISPAMCLKLREFGLPPSRIHERRNWADLDQAGVSAGSSYRERWNIAAPVVALYSGNIANKQGIELVIAAARTLAHRSDIQFVICGEGPNRAALEAEAQGLANLMIRDLQPAERLGDLLALATVHLLPQRAEAADLVLPSKLTNMLASGRPVVATAAEGTGLAAEVEGCGIRIEPGDAAGMAKAVTVLADDPGLRDRLGAAARHRALDRWARERVIDEFESGFAGCVTRRAPSCGS